MSHFYDFIAAIALSNHLTVVTNNLSEFNLADILEKKSPSLSRHERLGLNPGDESVYQSDVATKSCQNLHSTMWLHEE